MVQDNFHLIYPIVRSYAVEKFGYIDRDDLVQMASIHLLNAAKSFDETKGYAFSTYATTCIRNGLNSDMRSLRSNTFDYTNERVITEDEEGNDWSETKIGSDDSGFGMIELKASLTEIIERISKKSSKHHIGAKVLLGILEGRDASEVIAELPNKKAYCQNCLSLVRKELRSEIV